jgi:hypothetical protein
MFAVSSKDHGRLNHVTSKNAMEAPEVVLAKIDVEGAPAIVRATTVSSDRTSRQIYDH